VAYVPQSLGLIPELTIQDHIEMTQALVPAVERIESTQIEAYLSLMNLKDKWSKPVGTLSGGERQRVAILRALCRKTDLIIADEPTGAQDFEMTWKLMDLFVKINLAGTTLLLATHDLEMVRRLRKRCAILKDGVFKVEDRV
jgi:cell division transport system ATP-binding protein